MASLLPLLLVGQFPLYLNALIINSSKNYQQSPAHQISEIVVHHPEKLQGEVLTRTNSIHSTLTVAMSKVPFPLPSPTSQNFPPRAHNHQLSPCQAPSAQPALPTCRRNQLRQLPLTSPREALSLALDHMKFLLQPSINTFHIQSILLFGLLFTPQPKKAQVRQNPANPASFI